MIRLISIAIILLTFAYTGVYGLLAIFILLIANQLRFRIRYGYWQ